MSTALDIDLIELRPDARPLNAAKVQALAQSIGETFLVNPVLVRPLEGGRFELIAGGHRLQAHRLLGLAEIEAEIRDLDDIEAELAMIDENLCRAELSPAEAARAIDRRKALYELLHPETRPTHEGGGGRNNATRRQLGDDIADRFTAETAKMTGQSERAVQRAAERGAKVADAVLDFIRGTPLDTGVFLDQVKNYPAGAQMELARQNLLAITSRSAELKREKADAKKEGRATREAELGARQLALPDRRYGVIYADPEWRFEPYSRDTGMDRAADNHYPTSSLEAIKARPVGDIAAVDCVLFLWATAPMLPQALEVMTAWGFAYKSQVIWRKCGIDSRGGAPEKVDRGRYSTSLVLGTGYWFRNAHELLLVGTRGNVPAPAMGTQFPSVIDATPLRHSQKPERFAELIEAYFPNLPRIELNAREPRAGWDAWGLEAPAGEAPTRPAAPAFLPSGRSTGATGPAGQVEIPTSGEGEDKATAPDKGGGEDEYQGESGTAREASGGSPRPDGAIGNLQHGTESAPRSHLPLPKAPPPDPAAPAVDANALIRAAYQRSDETGKPIDFSALQAATGLLKNTIVKRASRMGLGSYARCAATLASAAGRQDQSTNHGQQEG